MSKPCFCATNTAWSLMVPMSLSWPPEKAKKMVSDNVMSAPDTVDTIVESFVRYGSDQKTFCVIHLTEVILELVAQ
ncbi:hypothetical protein MCEGE14_03138 [Burkholderiaceae bacterium]